MRLNSAVWFACLLSLSLPACSHDGATSQSSPEALRMLSDATAFYRQQPGIRVDTHLEAVLHDSSGQPIESARSLIENREIGMMPSNRYLLRVDEYRVASDGESIYLNRMLEPTTSKEAPAADNVDSGAESTDSGTAVLSDVYFRTKPAPQPNKLSQLGLGNLFGGPSNLLILGLLDPGLSEAIGGDRGLVHEPEQTTIDGKPAHRLEITGSAKIGDHQGPGTRIELWIAADGDPLLLQTRISTPPRPMNLGGAQIEAMVVTTEKFGEWQLGPDVAEGEFGPVPGSRRIGDIGQIALPPSPLIGQPAPDVKLALLDGTTLPLTALRDEGKIVLLDFWATWCGPCLMELPVLARIAQERADDGVVLYAVNQGERADAIQMFQAQQKYQFSAALDEEGSIAEVFGVGSIPHLCIISRDGTVQVVHVGVGDGTEEAIRAEVDALVAGRNLAVDGLPE